jgi:amino acid transporter
MRVAVQIAIIFLVALALLSLSTLFFELPTITLYLKLSIFIIGLLFAALGIIFLGLTVFSIASSYAERRLKPKKPARRRRRKRRKR